MRDDDDDIQDYAPPKRQVNEVYEKIRNDTLEEVAKEFESMRIAFGDTSASFARYVREMKR